MTSKERKQRVAVLKQQLTLINLYPEDFIERLGKRGLEFFINEILDEILYHKEKLEKDE